MSDVAALGDGSAPRPLLDLVRLFCRAPVATIALIVFVALFALAFAAPWIAPQNPYDLARLDIMEGRLAPGTRSYEGYTYWLGTDGQGRDLLSAIFYGLRTSLIVGGGSAILASVVGVTLGLVAAFFGRFADAFIMRVVDLQLSMPSILVALMILAVLGPGTLNVVLALVIVEWALYARTARAAALSERRRDYMEAAYSLAIPSWRLVFRHLLPNCLPPLTVIFTIQVAQAIILEATLSFLGVGVPITQPSLGLLISNGYQYVISGYYWIALFPGIFLVVTVFSINLIGDRLRVILNPRASP